jgi:hypothetical protein
MDCVPVLFGPHKLGPNKHGQFVLMVKTLIIVEKSQTVPFYRAVYRVFLRKTKPKLQQKFKFYPKKHITMAIMLCYDFALSHNAFILFRIIIAKEIYSKIKVFANGWRRKFSY